MCDGMSLYANCGDNNLLTMLLRGQRLKYKQETMRHRSSAPPASGRQVLGPQTRYGSTRRFLYGAIYRWWQVYASGQKGVTELLKIEQRPDQ